MKRFLLKILPLIDPLLALLVYPCGWLLKGVRRIGVHRLPMCRSALINVGVFPIRNHYYEPQFDYRNSHNHSHEARNLPGIDWNVSGQLEVLSKFSFTPELADTPQLKPSTLDFYMKNDSFLSGDAEYWYQLIRLAKPRRIFEIGSGNSTLMAAKATRKNQACDPNYKCKHVCIEPFEKPWLEQTGISVLRKKVEDVEPSFFSELEENDILFIDSSHVIRPAGDVLFEYLELLPQLKKGVIVHVHDIFSPRNYPKTWLEDELRLWNEQYLVEAFLSHNRNWKVLGALNFLHHNYFNELKSIAPFLTPDREPGSLYIQRTS